MIKVILIDIDDTLLDFRKGAALAIKKTCSEYGVPFSDEMLSAFFETTSLLWSRIEKGTLTKPELYKLRWTSILSGLGIDFDGELFEETFRANFRGIAVPVEGAVEMLQALSKDYRLFAASNASYDQQIERLTKSGMLRYIEKVFASEKLGYVKPSTKFFEECMKSIGSYEKDEVIILGDSLSADISGGKAYGIRTCYFDRGYQNNKKSDVIPDFTVTSLSEVKNILKNI